ncbi:MAG: GNAT family N-acetyltransferase [Defluviitaleaceae bacterium]|nr:GNAT family N-acetyltransferase [Defluviitaleaceae bacterium]
MQEVILVAITPDLWHKFHKSYIVDPAMSDIPYTYNYEKCHKHYISRISDPKRREFAIMSDSELVGLIGLKRINEESGQAEFGIALVDDSVKGRGFGTRAIGLLISYAKDELNLNTILADSVHRNTRSQHVLEKNGFAYTHEDTNFKFYKLIL